MTPPRRHELTDEQWEKLEPLLPPQKPHTGRPRRRRHVSDELPWASLASYRNLSVKEGNVMSKTQHPEGTRQATETLSTNDKASEVPATTGKSSQIIYGNYGS